MRRGSTSQYTDGLKEVYSQTFEDMDETYLDSAIDKTIRDFRQEHHRPPNFHRFEDIREYHEKLAAYLTIDTVETPDWQPVKPVRKGYGLGEFHDLSDVDGQFVFDLPLDGGTSMDDVDIDVEPKTLTIDVDGDTVYRYHPPQLVADIEADREACYVRMDPDEQEVTGRNGVLEIAVSLTFGEYAEDM